MPMSNRAAATKIDTYRQTALAGKSLAQRRVFLLNFVKQMHTTVHHAYEALDRGDDEEFVGLMQAMIADVLANISQLVRYLN